MIRRLIHAVSIAACTATLLANGVCQQATSKPAAELRAGHKVVSRMPLGMLAQLSDSLEQLAAKVAPAVVQIEVSGLGTAEDAGRKNAAVMVRQHAIGTGVIMDPN